MNIAFGIEVVTTEFVSLVNPVLGVMAGHDDRIDLLGYGHRNQLQPGAVVLITEFQVDKADIESAGLDLRARRFEVRGEFNGMFIEALRQ